MPTRLRLSNGGSATIRGVAGVGPQGPQGEPGPTVPEEQLTALRSDIATDVADSESEIGGALNNAIVNGAVPRGGDVGRGGRGLLSITLDDGVLVHFTEILPISKAMGFPMGTAWNTDNGNDAYVQDAYDAGWEIMSHLAAHDDATALSEAALKASLESAVTKISGITGDSRNIGFVYPYHFRNTATDRIVSRYHPWARGQGGLAPINYRHGRSWLVSALNFDNSHDASGNLTSELKRWLQGLAAVNGSAAGYFHYTGAQAGRVQAIVNLVNYARSLGIQIVRPSDVRAASAVSDPASTSEWTLGTGVTVDSTTVVRPGEPSFKVTPNGSGGGALTTTIVGKRRVPVGPNPGKFTTYRAWLRYHNPSGIAHASNGGLRFGATLFGRNRQPQLSGDAEGLLYGSAVPVFNSLLWPGAGTMLAAQDWGPFAQLITVGPEVSSIWPAVELAGLTEAGAAFHLSDIRFDKMDESSTLTYRRALFGTTGVTIHTNILNLDRCGITITPVNAAPAGQLYYTATAGGALVVKSTNAADTGLVQVTVHPGNSYIADTLSGSLV